jgi:ribose 5-phosphate isomerase B
MRLGIANDHAGYALKIQVVEYLKAKGLEPKDFGAFSDASVDYADFAHPLAYAIENHELDLGITICGSGNGINIAANKHQGIRSALCWTAEISELARLHNDANICALPGRFISFEEAKAIIDKFLVTPFEGGRHCARVEKIPIKK